MSEVKKKKLVAAKPVAKKAKIQKEVAQEEKSIGPVDYSIKLEDGCVVITLNYESKGLDSNHSFKLKADYFADKLAAAIPGEVDDLVINMLKKLLVK